METNNNVIYKDIAIYGAGGLGREIAAGLNTINLWSNRGYKWRLVGFFDDGIPAGTQISHFGKTLGGINEVNAWATQLNVVMAIGLNGKTVERIVNQITNPHISFPNIIAPDVFFCDSVTTKMGRGNIINGPTSISTDVEMGDFNFLNGSIVLGHDVKIGDFNSLMPGVKISGSVELGNFNTLGVNAVVIQGIKIGSNTTIGPGAILLSKPKENSTYLGNPAKIFKF